MNTILNIVSHQRFFEDLTESQIRVLAEHARYRRFRPGELVFRDGNTTNRFYIVVTGKVVLETLVKDQAFTQLQTVSAGEVLGWPSLLPHDLHHLRARAMESTEVIYYAGGRLRQLCDKDHDLGYQLSQRLAEVTMARLQTARGLLSQRPAVAEAIDWRPGDHW